METRSRHKARAIKGSVQYGQSSKGTPQINIDLDIENVGRRTVALYLSPEAAPFAFARLRACGWQGQSASDLANMDGIDANLVDVDIIQDVYEGKPTTKVEIVSGGGRFEVNNPTDAKSFAAKVAALLGNTQSSGGNAPPPPPFG